MNKKLSNVVELIVARALNLPQLATRGNFKKLTEGERVYFNVDRIHRPNADGFILFEGDCIVVKGVVEPLDMTAFSLKFSPSFIQLIIDTLSSECGMHAEPIEVYHMVISAIELDIHNNSNIRRLNSLAM